MDCASAQPRCRVTQIVLTTFADEQSAAEAVRKLVTEHLAACGTMMPGARSIYFWDGKLEENTETVVLFKTTRAEELAIRLKEIHPYETPEIITFEADAVSAPYAHWLQTSCEQSPGKALR